MNCVYSITAKDKVIYIGSTTNFDRRIRQHKYDYKKRTRPIHKYIYEIGWDAITIQPIIYTGLEGEELLKLEEKYIRLHKDTVKNIRIPYRTYKEYRENNRDKILKYNKEYRENNREIFLKYYENNRDKFLKYQKEYYENNQEIINKKQSCECGDTLNKQNLARHKKSQKHINKMLQ